MSKLDSGDWVQVKSVEEILSTLDGSGSLDSLPFMPEMLSYSGKKFRVSKSAHKTCDTISNSGHSIRRMAAAVHLDDIRCDGHAHGGCQAGCLLFWKEAWLKRVDAPPGGQETASAPEFAPPDAIPAVLARATHADEAGASDAKEQFRCQATELLRATHPAKWWDPRLYLRDLTSGNVSGLELARYVLLAGVNLVLRHLGNRWSFPSLDGLAGTKTPSESLGLQEGESVEVRPKHEITPTLNRKLRNRGLTFDVEMLPYCGSKVRVLRRIEKFIDDKTGFMRTPPNPCLILEGVACGGRYSRRRLFCPRAIYPFWHEIWLRRVPPTEARHS